MFDTAELSQCLNVTFVIMIFNLLQFDINEAQMTATNDDSASRKRVICSLKCLSWELDFYNQSIIRLSEHSTKHFSTINHVSRCNLQFGSTYQFSWVNQGFWYQIFLCILYIRIINDHSCWAHANLNLHKFIVILICVCNCFRTNVRKVK